MKMLRYQVIKEASGQMHIFLFNDNKVVGAAEDISYEDIAKLSVDSPVPSELVMATKTLPPVELFEDVVDNRGWDVIEEGYRWG